MIRIGGVGAGEHLYVMNQQGNMYEVWKRGAFESIENAVNMEVDVRTYLLLIVVKECF